MFKEAAAGSSAKIQFAKTVLLQDATNMNSVLAPETWFRGKHSTLLFVYFESQPFSHCNRASQIIGIGGAACCEALDDVGMRG